MEKQSEKNTKQRKFLLILPLLVLPFVTLTFWALGGGRGTDTGKTLPVEGINTELPGAQLSDGSLDKMSLYGRSGKETDTSAEEDSVRWLDSGFDMYQPSDVRGYTTEYSTPADPNELKVRQRLDELERMLAMQEVSSQPYQGSGYKGYDTYADSRASQERLELMMHRMTGGSDPDPELRVLDGMLEKIIDIQHPDRMREKSLENRGAVYAVERPTKKNQVPHIHRIDASQQTKVRDSVTGVEPRKQMRNGFYTLTTDIADDIGEVSGIPGVVHETQTVVNGANLKIRLTEDIYLNGMLIPAGHFVTGECSLNGERLQVKVTGVRFLNYQLPVSLTVYDLDGLPGIRIPGAIGRDAAREGSDRAIQGVQFMSMDPWAQAAGAGIEAAKGFLSKKVRLIRVTVKAGHPIFLYDEQSGRK